mmetsp:Transcript_29374/g.83609  ORF Transcript_29374/g.83609 Transcript_29374/m.83609 type:complete len:274 (+) Transcript_29374:1258-2079(+)
MDRDDRLAGQSSLELPRRRRDRRRAPGRQGREAEALAHGLLVGPPPAAERRGQQARPVAPGSGYDPQVSGSEPVGHADVRDQRILGDARRWSHARPLPLHARGRAPGRRRSGDPPVHAGLPHAGLHQTEGLPPGFALLLRPRAAEVRHGSHAGLGHGAGRQRRTGTRAGRPGLLVRNCPLGDPGRLHVRVEQVQALGARPPQAEGTNRWHREGGRGESGEQASFVAVRGCAHPPDGRRGLLRKGVFRLVERHRGCCEGDQQLVHHPPRAHSFP